ncbi:hypothetical protein T484DRAFT_1830255, partial [Baffinella frigidus]
MARRLARSREEEVRQETQKEARTAHLVALGRNVSEVESVLAGLEQTRVQQESRAGEDLASATLAL